MDLDKKLIQLKKRHAELGDTVSAAAGNMDAREFGKISKEYSDLSAVVEIADRYLQAKKDLVDSEEMLKDPEMKDLAYEEVGRLRDELPKLEHELKIALLPKDAADDRNAIVEIRAGTGGEEASLFAGDLFRMYEGYAAHRGWKFEVLEGHESDLKGFKDVSIQISGPGVYARLKYESGGHRVQRVPETESGGRVHTSAATVAVMPEAEEVDVNFNMSDVRVDTYRASGAGGQHVNKTDSAVRLTHLPTNTVVQCQDGRSQHKNKEAAMKMLMSKLYELQRQKIDSERAETRKSLVGTGDRSARIRTYNFPQSRVSDHRINLTLYKLDAILAGAGLDEIIDALITEDQIQLMQNA